MRAIRVTPSGPKILWSHCQHQIFQSSPAIGDLDGNGRMALVVGTGTGPSGDAVATNSLRAFHLDNGSPVRGLAGRAQRSDLRLAGHRRRDRRSQERRGRRRVRDVQRRRRVGVQRARRADLEPVLRHRPHRDPLDADPRRPQRRRRQRRRGRASRAVLSAARPERRAVVPADRDQPHRAELGRGRRLRAAATAGGSSIQSWVPQGDGQPQNGAGRSRVVPAAEGARDRTGVAAVAARPRAHRRRRRPLPAKAGYWLVSRTGGVFAYGNAHYYGSTRT